MPLLGALEYGYLEVAHLLVGHGANIDAEDDEGRTAFQVASEYCMDIFFHPSIAAAFPLRD
jgi:ankyrin repeat protein